MSNSIRSPEVITSIVFGIFACALGIVQVLLYLVHRKHRKDPAQSGEVVLARSLCKFADRIAGHSEPRAEPGLLVWRTNPANLVIAVDLAGHGCVLETGSRRESEWRY
jgi:hypothetical protein